jgi:hypothetical protein
LLLVARVEELGVLLVASTSKLSLSGTLLCFEHVCIGTTRKHAADFSRQALDDVLAELLILPNVLALETELVGLVHIATAHGLDLSDDVKDGTFLGLGSW